MHFDPHQRGGDGSSRVPHGFSEADFSLYWKILSAPVAIAAALAVFFLWLQPLLPTWRIALLEGALFFALAALSARRELEPGRSAVVAGIAGFLLGIVVALVKVLKLGEAYLYFNLVSEPALTAMFGAMSGWAFGTLMVHFLRVARFARQLPKTELDGAARARR